MRVYELTYWPWQHNAIMLAPLGIFMRAGLDPDHRALVLVHEDVHVEQWRRNPWTYYPRYLWAHFKYGYWDNPFEVEARERSGV